MPLALRDGFRIERYGAPFAGGWMQWPLRWLRPVDLALNVYYALKAVSDAMSTLKGDALTEWQRKNSRLLKAVEQIQAIRETESTDDV